LNALAIGFFETNQYFIKELYLSYCIYHFQQISENRITLEKTIERNAYMKINTF